MFIDNVVTLTELRTKPNKVLDSLTSGKKVIFSNNKPKAVLVGLDEYKYYEDIKRAALYKEELEEAKNNWPFYTAEEFMTSLLSDD